MSFFIDKATFLLHSIQYIVWERNIESLKNNLWLLSAGHLAGWAAAPRGTLSLAAAVFAVAAAAVALAGHQPEHQAGQLRLRVILFSHLTCWLRAAWQKHPIKEEKREIHKKKIMCRPINNCKQYCGAGRSRPIWLEPEKRSGSGSSSSTSSVLWRYLKKRNKNKTWKLEQSCNKLIWPFKWRAK